MVILNDGGFLLLDAGFLKVVDEGAFWKTDSSVDNLDDGAIRRILHDAGSNLALDSPVVERLCCHEEISRGGIIELRK